MIVLNCRPLYTAYTFRDVDVADITNIVSTIRGITQARPSGYQYMPAYKSGRWDGYIRLSHGNEFPTGLVSAVVDGLRSNNYSSVEILNYRTPDVDTQDIKPNMFNDITLRPYQIQAARLCLSYGRGVLKMATNSGKTAVIAAIAKVVPGNVLVLTTKKDLLYQTSTYLSHCLQEPVGLIGDGHWKQERITVGMIQTLSNCIDRIQSMGLDCVVYDECHHLSSRTSQNVFMATDAPMRFGFSGTPLRYDNLSDLILVASTGPVLMEVTNADLIEFGISAEPTITMYVIDNVDCDGTWQEAYDVCIVNNTMRNDVICKVVKHANAASTLILVDRISHGALLQNRIANAVFVHGSVDISMRQEALEDLRRGDGAIVIATAAIFGEGVDAPAVDLLLLANGGKGHVKLLQNIGRGMRAKGGENKLSIVDFVDCGSVYLLEHSLARVEIYEREGFEVVIAE